MNSKILTSWFYSTSNRTLVSATNSCAVFNASPGRGWLDLSCSGNIDRFACQNTRNGRWETVPGVGDPTFSGGEAACQAFGDDYAFSVPVNATSNEALRQAATEGDLVLLNLRSDDGVNYTPVNLDLASLPSNRISLLGPNRETRRFVFNSNNQFRYFEIPEDTPWDVIEFEAFGAPGGGASATPFVGSAQIANPGPGAAVRSRFRIGSGIDQIRPGSGLGIVVGELGSPDESDRVSILPATGGGGGGSGVLLFPPGSDDWEPLIVAAGGGGGYAIDSAAQTGQNGNDGGLVPKEDQQGGFGVKTAFGGGGGAVLEPRTDTDGVGGGRSGGRGGLANGVSDGAGGFGFGGGGAGGGSLTGLVGAGSGGGYRGGDGAFGVGRGAAGGSYAHATAESTELFNPFEQLSNVFGAIVVTLIDIPNSPPVANDNDLVTAEDQFLFVSRDVSDPEGDFMTTVLDTQPTNGGVGSFGFGFLYTPDRNFCGSDSFTYHVNDGEFDSNVATVTIDVTCVADSPVANDDDYDTTEDGFLVAPRRVLLNDTDPDGDFLTAVLDTTTSNGSLLLSDFGVVVYTPDRNFCGSDSFTYHANDGGLDSNVATATIEIACINDPPVANSDDYAATEDLSLLAASVLDDDTDPDADTSLTAILDSTGKTNGTVKLNPNGTFSYSPDPNFCGSASFTYHANDGESNSNVTTVTIDVACVNDPPVATDDPYSTDEDTPLTVPARGVLGTDSDVDGDELTAALDTGTSNGSLTLNADGSLTYTPDENFNGGDSFTYHARDGTDDSNVATVTITVNSVNDPPVAKDDTYSTDEDTPLTVAGPGVLGNDDDPVEGDALTAVLDTSVSNGSLTLNADGSLTYTPDANFNGSDSFTYHASDGSDDSNVATVTITVNPVNDPPVAKDDSYSTDEDTPLTVAGPGVLGNDDDPVEGDALTALLNTEVSNGSLTLNADGSLTYAPDPNFNGSDSFTYHANDGTDDSNVVTVRIVVNPVNDPPVAKAKDIVLSPALDLCTADGSIDDGSFDVDGDPVTIALAPAGPFPVGATVVTLTITDDSGASDSATATATVLDEIAPVTVAIASPLANANGWNNTDVTVTLGARDGCSDVETITYRLSGAETRGSTDPGSSTSVVITAEGTTTITFFATDTAGNIESEQTLTVSIDQTSPEITGLRSPDPNANNWNNTDVGVDFECTDALSGLDASLTICSDKVVTTEGARQSVTAAATDRAGNSSTLTLGDINIDKTPPTIGADPDPDPNPAGWNNTPVTVSFIAADGLSGVGSVTGPITFATEGTSQLANGVATDLAGNSAGASAIVNIDLTPAEIKNQFNPETLTVDVLALDLLSGLGSEPLAPDSCEPIRWGGDDDDDDDGGGKNNAERCTFTATDAAGNVTVLVEKRKTSGSGGSNKNGSSKKSEKEGGGGSIQIVVLSVQYNGGDVIEFPPKADKKFEWSLDKDGTLKELEQKMEIGKGKTRRQVTADYSSKKEQTEFAIHGEKGRLVGDGLRVLCMVTEDGELSITFDRDGLVPTGGGSDKSGKSSAKGSKKSSSKGSSKNSGKG